MNRVKVIRDFYDLENDVQREVGEELEVSDERLKVLLGENHNEQTYVEVLEKTKKTSRKTKAEE